MSSKTAWGVFPKTKTKQSFLGTHIYLTLFLLKYIGVFQGIRLKSMKQIRSIYSLSFKITQSNQLCNSYVGSEERLCVCHKSQICLQCLKCGLLYKNDKERQDIIHNSHMRKDLVQIPVVFFLTFQERSLYIR